MNDENDYLPSRNGDASEPFETQASGLLRNPNETSPSGDLYNKRKKYLEKARTVRGEQRVKRTKQKKVAKDMFNALEPRCIRAIGWLVAHSKSEDMRFKAAQYLLDRSLGKIPDPPKVFSGPDGGPIQLEDRRPSLAILFGLDQMSKTPLPPTIEGETEEPSE